MVVHMSVAIAGSVPIRGRLIQVCEQFQYWLRAAKALERTLVDLLRKTPYH